MSFGLRSEPKLSARHRPGRVRAGAGTAAARETAACGASSAAGLPYSGTLTSVVAFSACDVWAAGNQGKHSLVVHWNGRGWTLVRSGVVNWDLTGQPAAIGGTSDRDLWLAAVNAEQDAIIEHWNGTRFSRVSLPLPAGAKGAVLSGVSAVSRTDAWAAGYAPIPGTASTDTLVEHWNGRAWSIAESADPSVPSQYGPGRR
jgi:hypothetical protein